MAKHAPITILDKARDALNNVLDNLAAMKLADLKPAWKYEVYPWAVTFIRVELTWRHVGPGLGFAFRSFDGWIGWPPKSSR